MANNQGSTRLTTKRMPYITDDEAEAYARAMARGSISKRMQICQTADMRRNDGVVMRPHLLEPGERPSAKPEAKPQAKPEGRGDTMPLHALGAAFQAFGAELIKIAKAA